MSRDSLRFLPDNVPGRRWSLIFFIVVVGAYVLSSTFLVGCSKNISYATKTNQILTARIENVNRNVDLSHRNVSQRETNAARTQLILEDDNVNGRRETNATRIQFISEYHTKGLRLRKKFNCSKLFGGDVKEGFKVTNYLTTYKGNKNLTVIPDGKAVELFGDCEDFKSVRGYAQTAKTDVERDFPIAYVILMHEGFEQVERLIRTLYQPQNVFCIHVDLKSPESLQQTVRAFASCFPNIRLASVQHKITYAHVTRLLADITCMTDLSKLDHPWRYLITGVSTEFPLRSNKQKVDILTALNGSNHIREAWGIRVPERYTKQYTIVRGKMYKTNLPKEPAPHNITVVKGMAANAFSRAFVDWFHEDKMARDLLDWSFDTYSPDEHYWGTLNDLYHNPFLKTPGGYTGHPDTKHYQCTFANWVSANPNHTTPCYGWVHHNLCHFSSMDLPLLKDLVSINANKFDLKRNPVAYACMEELLEFRENHPQRPQVYHFKDRPSRKKRSSLKKQNLGFQNYWKPRAEKI